MLLEQITLQKLQLGQATIEFYLDRDNKLIELISLRVPQRYRRKGLAKDILTHLTEYADERGLTIKLIASPLDKKTNANKLVRFYQSFGFEIDRPANPAGDPWMIRTPKYISINENPLKE